MLIYQQNQNQTTLCRFLDRVLAIGSKTITINDNLDKKISLSQSPLRILSPFGNHVPFRTPFSAATPPFWPFSLLVPPWLILSSFHPFLPPLFSSSSLVSLGLLISRSLFLFPLFMASGSAPEVDPSSLLSPIGRLITDKRFHNLGIHAAIFRSWHFILSLEIEELLGNDYLFSFQDLESRNQILHLSPWTIKGHLLIVKPLVSGCLFSELDLSHTPIWVQVHGLPMTSSTVVEARAAGSRIGSVLEVDFRSSQKVWIIQFIRMKVEQGVTQPLILEFFSPSLGMRRLMA